MGRPSTWNERAPGCDCFINGHRWVILFLLLLGCTIGRADENLEVQWKIVTQSNSDSSPAVAGNGMIYFGDWKGRIWALKPDGERAWTFDTDMEIKSSPAVDLEGNVYFGCRNRNCYALDSNGRLLWRYRTEGWVDSSPALAADGAVIFGSWDGQLYALDSGGTRRWAFQTGGPIVSSPAIGVGGDIYFGSHDGKFYALSGEGKKLWEFSTGGPILSSPAIGADGVVYFTSIDGFFYALNRDGGLRWRLHTGGATEASPVVSPEGNLYLGVNRHLWNVSGAGEKLWARLDDGVFVNSPMMLSDGTVCFVSRYGMLKALLRDDVEWKDVNLRWQFYLYGHGYSSPGIGADGSIYIPAKWVEFYALNSKVPLAPSSWPKFRGNSRNTGNVADNQ